MNAGRTQRIEMEHSVTSFARAGKGGYFYSMEIQIALLAVRKIKLMRIWARI